LEGHVGDVQCCKFFPSGLVVLTGGLDTQLKIWSAENGECARYAYLILQLFRMPVFPR